MKPIIVFDLGGVLIDWNPRHLYRKLFTDEPHMEFFLREVVSSKWNHQMDAGKSQDVSVEELTRACPQYRDAIIAWMTRWDEMLGDAIETMPKVLQYFSRKSYELHAITNWSAETFHFAEKKYDFLKLFKTITVSGHEKVAKPNPIIFEIFLERHRLKASNCIFIDDAPRNIESAYSIGFETIHFTNPTDCIRELEDKIGDQGLLQFIEEEVNVPRSENSESANSATKTKFTKSR